jgi:hypothetical protein
VVIDIDSFVREVHGDQKHGAGYGYTRQLGYHPILAVRADTGEVLHIRNRKGAANTQRGLPRFIEELLARVRRAGHTGQVVIRADSGFENHEQFTTLDRERPRVLDRCQAVKDDPSADRRHRRGRLGSGS